jgi:hypothetical protein
MATTTTVTLLSTTTFGTAAGNYDGSSTSFSSDKSKGDGYYGFADGVHTIQSRVTNFVGTLKIQATLATTPVEADWATITTVITSDGSTAVTNGYLTTFTGNYVWVRVNVSEFTAGSINNVLLGH